MAVLARAEITLARVEIDEVVEQVGEVTVKVNGVEQQVSSLTAEVAGAVEDASEALTSVSSLEQDVSGFKTTVAQTYETKADADAAIAQERLDRQSAVEQSATQILQQVSETYLDKETGESLATKAEVEQTADGIRSEVSETYQTKAGMSAYATSSSVEQTAESIMSEVATEYQTKDGMSSYATKSYVDQQDGSIKSTVQSVKTTADSALTKATTVEQTAEGLEVTLTSTTSTANSALSKANSAASAASTAQSTADTAKANAATAQSTANAANTAAATAQTTASNAAKTATNFLKFDSSGLCVGDQTAGSLGMNALVAASKISLRSGATELATFSPTLIELGRNSQSAKIQMCGNVGAISAIDINSHKKLSIFSAYGIDFTDKMPGTSGSSLARHVDIFDLDDRVTALESTDVSIVALTPNTGLLNYSTHANSSVYLGNGVVLLQCAIVLSKATDWNSDLLTLFTIDDADMRPSEERYLPRMCTAFCGGGASSHSRGVRVYPNGNVRFQNLSGGTDAVNNVVIAAAYRI